MDDESRATPGSNPGLSLELQSDPPWLTPSIGGVTAAASGAFMAIFASFELSPYLGLLPGMTVAVFAGSALAAWARRRGGSASLQLHNTRLVLHERDHRVELLDLGSAYGASLLVDTATRRRILVLSQRAEPVFVLESLAAPGATAATAAHPFRDAPDGWAPRTVRARLDALALSASTAHVYALARGASLDPLLDALGPTLDAAAPWYTQPLGAGLVLSVDAREVSLGPRVLPREGLQTLPYALQVSGGRIAGLGLGHGEGALMLLGCEDATVARDAVLGDLSPDGFVAPATFEVLPLLAAEGASSRASVA